MSILSAIMMIPQDDWLKHFNDAAARLTSSQARAIQHAGLRECGIAGHALHSDNTYRSRLEALRSSRTSGQLEEPDIATGPARNTNQAIPRTGIG
eukprot:3939043-Rhodomonas_salina.1